MNKVPNLRFKEFSGKWEKIKLGDKCTFYSGGTPLTTNKKYYDGNIPFIRSAEISSTSTELNISEDGLNNSSAKMVKKGDLLYALYGATSGEVSISKIDGAINQAILCIQSDRLNLLFLEKILRKNKDNIINTYLQGGQGNLSSKIVQDLRYYFPSLEEQEKIAAFFSLIDKKIALQTEKVEELKNYKKGLMQKIFSQELRFKGFSGEWESKKIGSICEIIMGQSPSSACYNEDKIGLPLIQGNADIKNRKTFPRVYTSDITKTCDVGDIIMSVRAPVGAISRSLHHACIGRGVCSIKPKQNSEFIYQFLLNYENKWSRISQGSTFESINSFDITSTNIVLPLKEEQEKIASFFSLIDKKLELEMERLEKLQEYKKGLLQQMFI